MKIFLDMVGCRLNQAEIDVMAIDLVNRGAEIVSKPELADTIIVNTCCVTAKASADSRKMIRHYKNKFKAKVISTGCWVSVAQPEALEISDLAFLNEQKELIPEFLLQEPADTLSELTHKPRLGRRQRTRGFVKIQDGCNNACSFCLTTIARGKSHSTQPEEILKRVRQLENMGVKEIVLTGVQLGSWGKDFSPKSQLSQLLLFILDNSEITRIRLSSIEPWDIDQQLVEVFSNSRMMPHLHIPLQSGSDTILKAMCRPVNQQRFSTMLGMLRSVNPDIAIGTDVIGGFPGETDELFEESFQFIQECGFSSGHVFSFSPMPGTAAVELSNQVYQATIKQRTRRLLDHFSMREMAYRQAKIGATEQVLFESRKQSPDGMRYSGFTRDYQRADCISEENLLNKIRQVKLVSTDQSGNLVGELLSGDEPRSP
ncbi:MAG: MiaB/RimO family radical SAM methylthiotransferase [Chloroflexi bacterium]|nr:MiaB/RimO family radical SAM methylthiotransferase [Chloroflexota bacterium]